MDNKTFYCLFYLLSLLPYCFMTKYETEEENRDKRVLPAIPAYLYGQAVAHAAFWALAAKYGWYQVEQAGIIVKDDDSHSCYQNRGWCRPSCFSHEREISRENGVCGFNICCYPT